MAILLHVVIVHLNVGMLHTSTCVVVYDKMKSNVVMFKLFIILMNIGSLMGFWVCWGFVSGKWKYDWDRGLNKEAIFLNHNI